MPYSGAGTALGIAQETTHGTAVSRTHWFRLISETMRRTVKKNKLSRLARSSSRGASKHFIEADEAGGTVELELNYEGIGLLLQHILWGTPSTGSASGGLYPHTFLLAGTAPSAGLTMEVVRGDGTAEVFEGCRITKAVFRCEAGGVWRVTLDIIAETSGGRVSAGTPSYTTNEIEALHHHTSQFTWNSAAYDWKSVELTIDQKLSRRMLLGSLNTKDPKATGAPEFAARITREWEDDVLHAAYLADTESDLTFTLTGDGSRTIAFTLEAAYIEDLSSPVNTEGVVDESLSFMGQAQGANTGVKVVVTNTQSSAVAA